MQISALHLDKLGLPYDACMPQTIAECDFQVAITTLTFPTYLSPPTRLNRRHIVFQPLDLIPEVLVS